MLTRTLTITDLASFEAAIKNANYLASEDPPFQALCAYAGDPGGKRIAFMLPDKKDVEKSGIQASFECIAAIRRRNGYPPVSIRGYGRIESCLTLWDYFQNEAVDNLTLELSPFTNSPLYNGWEEDYGFDYAVISDKDKLAVRAMLGNKEWNKYYPSMEEFIGAMGLYNEMLEKGAVERFLYSNGLRFRDARKQYEMWLEEKEPGAILKSKKRTATNKVTVKNNTEASGLLASKSAITNIRNLIAEGEVEEAIDQAQKSSIGSVEITALSAKLSTLQMEVRMGIISRSDERLERSRIIASLLSLLQG